MRNRGIVVRVREPEKKKTKKWEMESELGQNRKLGRKRLELRLTGERDWLIGISSKERTERVNFSSPRSINLAPYLSF